MRRVQTGSSLSSTSGALLDRARAGESRAINRLFQRHGAVLRRWARGRLPPWARSFSDTADLVQDVLLQTFRRLDRFEDRGTGALRAYLRQAISNRIADEKRRVARRPIDGDLEPHVFEIPGPGPSPFDSAVAAQREALYKRALAKLPETDRVLVVGRLELGYDYEQLALVTSRATTEAARQAVRRAMLKLVEHMSDDAGGP
jgi:RNA polymerase sigma factor (sigma-70 family)